MGSKTTKAQEDEAIPEDLPPIPFAKLKIISPQLEKIVKTSIWVANFKRAFRGYLRAKPEKAQNVICMKIHAESKRDADLLGLVKDTYNSLLQTLVDTLGPLWIDDAVDFLRSNNKIPASAPNADAYRIANTQIRHVFRDSCDAMVRGIGEKIYHRYSRGLDAELSDIELDPEEKARLEAEKEARLKQAAMERQKQAESFQAEADATTNANRVREEEVQRMKDEQKKISGAAHPGSPGAARNGTRTPPPKQQQQQGSRIADSDML